MHLVWHRHGNVNDLPMYYTCVGFGVSCPSVSHAPALHHNGHVRHLVHERRYLKHLNSLLDALVSRHLRCIFLKLSAALPRKYAPSRPVDDDWFLVLGKQCRLEKNCKKNCESVNVDLEETNKKQKERIQRDENWVMNNTRKEEKLRSPWIRFFKRGPDSAKAKSMARGTHLRARCWNDYRWQMSSMLQNCSEEDSWEEWRLHIPENCGIPPPSRLKPLRVCC